MFEAILKFFKKLTKSNAEESTNSKDTAKERLHLVLMQDRANVSADFLELMKQEIIDVIKKYIEVDESAIDVRLTNKTTEDGENGAPALYANIPILNIRNDMKKTEGKPKEDKTEEKVEEKPVEETKTISEGKKEEAKEEKKEKTENKQEETQTPKDENAEVNAEQTTKDEKEETENKE